MGGVCWLICVGCCLGAWMVGVEDPWFNVLFVAALTALVATLMFDAAADEAREKR